MHATSNIPQGMERPVAPGGLIDVAFYWIYNESDKRFPVFQESHHHAVAGIPRRISGGPIQGVNNPQVFSSRRTIQPAFFGENRVLGKRFSQTFAKDAVGFMIGVRHKRAVHLALSNERRLAERADALGGADSEGTGYIKKRPSDGR